MSKKVIAADAMLSVLDSWGIDHIYGIPGSSLTSTMKAIQKSDTIDFIQVRHEETGPLAAAAEAKLGGKLGVVLGSGGPGATHLINGLYDAKMDEVPLVAILGFGNSINAAKNAFQETNQNPFFADVAVYNRVVINPQNLPYMIDDAIKTAYKEKGPAVITLPVDFGDTLIEDNFVPTAHLYKELRYPAPTDEEAKEVLELIKEAKRPVLYIGQGLRGHRESVINFADHFNIPVVASHLAKGIVNDDYDRYLISAGRVATKPANEAVALADFILFVGSDFPFGRGVFNPDATFVDVDIDSKRFGRRFNNTTMSIVADGAATLDKLVELGEPREEDQWLRASIANMENWEEWLAKRAEDKETPLKPETVYKYINKILEDDAIVVTDVGNSNVYSARSLKLNKEQLYTTSGWFATMGYGLPGAIGAKLAFPDRQVISIMGDGSYAMIMQEIITQKKYDINAINIVFTNLSFGFIEASQDDMMEKPYGILLQDAEFDKTAEAMGATAFLVTEYDQLEEVFEKASKIKDGPVLIEVKSSNERPLAVESLRMDPDNYTKEDILDFIEKYDADGLIPLSKFLKE